MTATLFRPKTVAEATALLAADPGAAIVAGGQELIPRLRRSGCAGGARLVSVTAIEDLRGVQTTAGDVTIGAATTHAEIAASPDISAAAPALAALAAAIADVQTRNRGSIGGAIVADPWRSDYHSFLLASDARIATSQRTIDVAALYACDGAGFFNQDELIVAVIFPRHAASAWVKHERPGGGYAAAAVCVVRSAAGPQIAAAGDGMTPMRLSALETAAAAGADLTADRIAVAIGGLAVTEHQRALLGAGLQTALQSINE